MATNRISNYPFSKPASAAVHTQPVAPAASVAIPHGFVICPPQLLACNPWQQEIYRLAYQRAQAAVQIPRHHRLLFSVWN